MTALDPSYARRLRRAIEDALTRDYGREAALRMIREAGRRQSLGAALFTERRSPRTASVGAEVEGGDTVDEK